MSEVAQREVFVVAACLDCHWREVGTSLHHDENRIVQLVPKHVRREHHRVVLSRTEVRTYVPSEHI
jgi:hypothetical protein